MSETWKAITGGTVLFKIVQNIESVRRSEQCQSALEEMFYLRGLERLHENGQISISLLVFQHGSK